MSNRESFAVAYRAGLRQALDQRPDDYPPMADAAERDQFAEVVSAKMLRAIDAGTFNHDGRGFRNACKSLGIKATRTAIFAYWKG